MSIDDIVLRQNTVRRQLPSRREQAIAKVRRPRWESTVSRALDIGSVCVCIALVGGCPKGRDAELSRQDQEVARGVAALEAELGFSLPKGTRVLWVERQQGMDDMVRAKLQMDQSGFDQLEAKLPIQSGDLRAGAGRLGTDHGAWNPHAMAGIRSAQATLEGARALNLGVAPRDDGTKLVFIMVHGT